MGAEKSMAELKSRMEWEKINAPRITLKLNRNTDADILAALDGKPKQTEIKRLIRIALKVENLHS